MEEGEENEIRLEELMQNDETEKFIEEEIQVVNNQLDDGDDSSIIPSYTPEPPSNEKSEVINV